MVDSIRGLHAACVEEIGRVIVGQREAIDGAFIAMLAGGHVLLEGVPGVAKTLIVRAVARTLSSEFRRIQFTPDLMPSDVTGATVLKGGDFVFREGPIFTNLLLGDEINRAPAKTQSALLEAMSERAVTADGVRHALDPLFTVFATQNPIEQEGTYPLPEAELDRFMMKIVVDYPDEAAEREILTRHHAAENGAPDLSVVGYICDAKTVVQLRKEASEGVQVSDEMIDYVTRLIRATRGELAVAVGVSPRAGLNLLRAAKVEAAILGRDFVIPDDVKKWAPAVLRHRLVLTASAEIGGTTPDDVVSSLLGSVPVPT